MRVLTESTGAVTFIEPTATKSTTRKRAFREGLVTLFESITAFFTLVVMTILDVIVSFFRQHTPFVNWALEVRRAWRLEAQSREFLKKEIGRTMKDAGLVVLVVLLAISLLLAYTMMGPIEFEFAPRERAWNWARTGVFDVGKI
ncbi:hypothetical protein AAF712_001818 [Marasmius tenuissimus]|uniref:Uncharacterized protein n=1 Tax=Marasmius tenuissimus TaxID=585030 RepID=A0ABR3ABA3_9AGAR